MANVLSEYLVALGWQVNQHELRQFNEALRHMSEQVERYTNNEFYGIVPKFVKAGAVITGALASITAGTIGLLAHTAQADLDFQVLARRMFMTGDAAKQMKIATDALGYSLEDIIWGPPELRKRYATLIEDQRRMQNNLGPDFEKQMVMIRDVRFEVTRFWVELQYFGMQLAGTIAKAIFGDKGDLLSNLQNMNAWFQQHIPDIANKVSSVLVPVLREVYSILKGIAELMRFLHSDDKLSQLWGSIYSKDKSFNQNMNDLFGVTDQDDVIGKVAKAGRESGNSALLLALAEKESGFYPGATNPRTHAFGLGQILPKNWPRGKNVGSVDDQIEVMRSIIFGNLQRHHGDIREALHDYYGHGTPGPGEPTFDQYYDDVMQRYNRWKKDPTSDPSLYHPSSYSTGSPININVAHSNASANDIAAAVQRGLDERDRRTNQRMAVQLGGVYA
jgi:hypothetical protein